MFPIIAWSRIANAEADERLTAWQHYLGPCNRPFGKISFGLLYEGEIVGVAVAATIVKNSCYGYRRTEVCELARCCCHTSKFHECQGSVRERVRIASTELWRRKESCCHDWVCRDHYRHAGMDILKYDYQ